MADGPEGYVTGLVWVNEPSEVPEGAISLRARLERPISGTWMGFVATVLDGPSEMRGQQIDVIPQNLTSCVGLGVREGYLVVYAEPVEAATDAGPRSFYEAIDYRPSEENERQRRRGGEQWLYPGEPATREEFSF
ncbi:hypothetical protein [Aurantiacibacter sp. MUD61]|uniref:hypothetical protein n=1 Tax=Aurantiacibacter sp. MUD61 TaxID=3009083 RepID=UPI0022F084D8|nr:hypothetical protein [Aurantiacibacter sp. MUD61]